MDKVKFKSWLKKDLPVWSKYLKDKWVELRGEKDVKGKEEKWEPEEEKCST